MFILKYTIKILTDAKAQVSQLIEMALRGKKVIITKHNKPLVELKPVEEQKGKRILGQSKGKIVLTESTDYLQTLKSIKMTWDLREEIDTNRKEIEN